MALTIRINVTPVPWKAPYVGKKGVFSPRYQVKKDTEQLLKSEYCGELITDPIRCDIYFYMPQPKQMTKHFATSGGDLTNLRKFYEDCLQGIVIENDRQIIAGYSAKEYSIEPHVIYDIQKIKPPEKSPTLWVQGHANELNPTTMLRKYLDSIKLDPQRDLRKVYLTQIGERSILAQHLAKDLEDDPDPD
jgi:Holliday junction resolvase RusA-like endonuclease